MGCKISIIIPVYNCEDSIRMTVESLINQSYSNWEMIIVDDGSTDNSLSICKELEKKNKKIKVISIKNSGVSNARNVGIENSEGEYITFIDADDYIDSNAYRECIDIIKKEDIDILRFSYIKDYGTIKKVRKYMSPTNRKINKKDYDKLVYDNVFCSEDYTSIWNAIIRRNIVSNIRFDTSLRYAEDFLFMMEAIIKSSSIYITDKPYYHYIVNSGSATLNYTKSNIINRMNNILVSNTKVLNMLGNDSKYLEKYDEKIKKSFKDKLGMIANNERYKTFKETAESIERLESYKTYAALIGKSCINKSYMAYLKCKITKKMKYILKKCLVKGA